MNLVPYTLTALSRQDIPDTPNNRNIVIGAVVTCTDNTGATVTMFDDAAGSNGSTAKQTGVNGQVTVYVEPGEYNFLVNGRSNRVIIGAARSTTSRTLRIPSQYNTLQAAVDATYNKTIPVSDAEYELLIESNHRPESGLLLENGDYGAYRITAEDAVVTLSDSFSGRFVNCINGVAPVLACSINGNNRAQRIYSLFNSSGSGAQGIVCTGATERALYLNASSADFSNTQWGDSPVPVYLTASTLQFGSGRVFGGTGNTGGCMRVSRTSRVEAQGMTVEDNAIGVAVDRSSSLNAHSATFRRNAIYSLNVQRGSTASVGGSTFSETIDDGIQAYFGRVSALQCVITAAVGNNGFGVRAQDSGEIDARLCTITGFGNKDVRVFGDGKINISEAVTTNGTSAVQDINVATFNDRYNNGTVIDRLVPIGKPPVRVVSNINDLRATSGIFDGQQVSVETYSATGATARSGGLFVWKSSSTANDDGWFVIAVTGVTTGRWVRQLSQDESSLMFVDRLSKLRNIAGRYSGQSIQLTSIEANQDSGGKVYRWSNTTLAADDNLKIVRPTGVSVGAWVRTNEYFVSSVNELRARAGAFNGEQVSLTGYYAGSTKGGGILVWDAASTAADDGGVTFAVTGVATGRWVRQLDGFVTPEMFGALGDRVADDYTSIQSAINYAAKSSRGSVVQFGNFDYLYSQGLIVDSPSVELRGSGVVATRLYCTASTGAAIRLNRPWNKVSKMQVNAFGARLASTDVTGYGIQIESDDIPEDTTARVQSTGLDDVEVINQPSHGIVGIGPALDGAAWNKVHSWLNGGHGIAIDRGLYTGRVNLPTTGIPGVLTINNARLSQNGGHAIACGHPNDNFSTPSLRVVINNPEIGPNCSDATIRHSLEQVWLRGSNHEINTPVFTGGGNTLGGIFVAGRNIHLRNLRAVNQTHTVRVGTFAELPTSGVYIDGISVINNTQPVAVILDVGVKNVRVETRNLENITQVMTPGRLGCSVEPIEINFIKQSDQIVNNSTTFTDITDFTVPLDANSTYKIEAEIYYTSPAAADIKVNCLVPSGATVKYASSQSLKVGDADSVAVDSVKVSSGSVVVFGGSASAIRSAVITGLVKTGVTSGNFRMQFAQVVADLGDTTVYSLSTIKVKRIIE